MNEQLSKVTSTTVKNRNMPVGGLGPLGACGPGSLAHLARGLNGIAGLLTCLGSPLHANSMDFRHAATSKKPIHPIDEGKHQFYIRTECNHNYQTAII
jgi:hypothetical protein